MSQKSRKSRPRPSRPAARPVAESPRSRPTLRDVNVREDLAAAATARISTGMWAT